MSSRDLILGEAELDDEENDESFDEETGEAKEGERGGKDRGGENGNVSDSSEEDEDEEDDEEAARQVREGFIVDEDEEDLDEGARRRKHKRKRRENRERAEEALDEEDLDLIGENDPAFQRREPAEPQYKRLKRGHKEDRERGGERGLAEIFSDDEEEQDAAQDADVDRLGRFRAGRRAQADEFDDFIEEDELTDEGERDKMQEDMEVARPRAQPYTGANPEASGLTEETLEVMMEAFGDGQEYQWALDMEDEEEEKEYDEQRLELKDVFEPSQLAEKMMTDDDNEIRWADEPERFQLARKPYRRGFLTDEQFKEEALWISKLMLPKKRLQRDLIEPFQKAVGKVLEFFVTDEVEVPFVFQHRKDYLIHAAKVPSEPDPYNPDAPEYVVSAEKLLVQNDLWQILDLDLKFRALVDKRNTIQRSFENLQNVTNVEDEVLTSLLPQAETIEELQDIQDYLHFRYVSLIKDAQALRGQVNGSHRRPAAQRAFYERVRNGKVYNLVRAFGITAEQFAENASEESGRRRFDTEDPNVRPDDMADSEDCLDPPEFTTGAQALKAAKLMFAEEIAIHPKVRNVMRKAYYLTGVIECWRTEKGLRKIDEQHPYYEFKYLRNQQMSDIAARPDMYLRMLKAENEGLVEVTIRLQGFDRFKKSLLSSLMSDNFSEIADAWNDERRQVLDMALNRLDQLMKKNVKEHLKSQCEDEIVNSCREEYSRKLDQAPFKPPGEILGSTPRVIALSHGQGAPGRDAICWAWVEEDGRVLEHGKFRTLRDENSPDRKEFLQLIERRKPDALAVSGFSAETHQLKADISHIIEIHNIRGAEFDDPETGKETSRKLDVVLVNDEVARLYHTSERAALDYPGLAPLVRYCAALAKYMQNPMKEYASLGRDIISIQFHPSQQLVPQEKLMAQLETAMVDMVNLCGVDVNEAVADVYTANLLPYVCGLGPRKATSVLKAINANGGVVNTRDELVGDPEENKLPVVGPRVWNNCASFLYIEYDSTEPTSDYLDHTRVHPEDYELGRKMAADALELDEEDVKAEIDESGPAAIVRKLIKDDAQDKVNDLVLEEYAEQLERNFNQRKRATLETIRAELQQPYEELRRNFSLLSEDETFTMLTGETRESLYRGMVVPVQIKKVWRMEHRLEAMLDCGVRAFVDEAELGLDRDVDISQAFQVNQTVQAKILSLHYDDMQAVLSLRESEVQNPERKLSDRMGDEWDDMQEDQDREELREKNKLESGRTQRVIKHPLFRNFNAMQAEEYLGSQARGDAVIRPSSKGPDHIAITWKVADNVYQHIDVLELDKENEFSVGRTLKIGGRYSYTDLDELIVNHVKAMARKVDEITLHEKFQSGNRPETERWLTTYTEANPKRSAYAFCIDSKHPGYFLLCFKAGQHAQLGIWPIKVIPQAFELKSNAYPDMRALCNGFKLLFGNMQSGKRR